MKCLHVESLFTVRIGFLPLPGLLTEDTYEVEKDLYDTAYKFLIALKKAGKTLGNTGLWLSVAFLNEVALQGFVVLLSLFQFSCLLWLHLV